MIIKGRKFINVSGGIIIPPDPTPSNVIKLKVTFLGNPENLSFNLTPAKYNAPVVATLEKDDSSNGIWGVDFPLLHGGIAVDGFITPGFTHSDGCGNLVKWKAAAGLFCLNQFGVDLMEAQAGGAVGYDAIYTMIQNDWFPENHGMNSPNSQLIGAADRYQQIHDLTVRVYEQMLSRGLEYRIRGMVNPGSSPGYTFTGLDTEIAFFSSEGSSEVRDGFNFVGGTNANDTLDVIDYKNLCLLRLNLGENYNEPEDVISNTNNYINGIISRGTRQKPSILRMFSHGPYNDELHKLDGYRTVMNSIYERLGKEAWVPSTTELYEYLETKALVNTTESLEGNLLTVEFDLSDIPEANKLRDLSMLVTGGTIVGVEVENADRFTFNAETGLVNIFKRKTSGFKSPMMDLEPPKLATATYSDDNLYQIKLTFNMQVSQSIFSAYFVSEYNQAPADYPVISISGEGYTWYLNLANPLPVIQGTLVINYAGHLGDVTAVNPNVNLKGTSIYDSFTIVKV